MNMQYLSIHLTAGLSGLKAYIMAYLKHMKNCNGTGIVSSIVMVYFKNNEVIMAWIQLPLFL
jgi:hypothetical protein